MSTANDDQTDHLGLPPDVAEARCAELERERDALSISCSNAVSARDAAEARCAELEEELRLTLIASHVHADEHRQQRDLAARYRYVIEREIVFYEEEAECGVSFYEGTFQQRAAALRAALAGQEVGR